MIDRLKMLGAAIAVALLPGTAHAQDNAPPAPAALQEPTATERQKAIKEGNRAFAGLELGVGLSFTIDRGRRDRIGSAMLVNDVVRVDDQNNNRARVMLESHYFFTPGVGGNNPDDPTETPARWGFGPFVAIQPGSEEVIEAIGMGVMIGLRRGDTGQSFNLGIGYVVDPNTRVLGDGLEANVPLPPGETDIRYKETAQSGVLILTSFSF
jgi:hypothetical protein